ncbi:MAG: RNA-binding protein [Candidatus Margulisiibacteriota bacterium]
MKTLYVGNLPWGMKDTELVQAFEQICPVLSARIIIERETNRSRGFGFVEVADENAEKLISSMNGSELAGRKLVVNEAKPKTSKF